MNIKQLLTTGVVAAMALAVVPASAWLEDPEFTAAHGWGLENGLTTMQTPTSFNPYGLGTREQFARFLASYATTNLCLERDTTAACNFSDIPADPTLDEFVIAACELGIVRGKDGMYYPTADMTKAQFITALVRSIRAAAGENPLLDETVSPRWSGYHAEAVELQITKETDPWALDRAVTRAEAIVMLYRSRIDNPVCAEGEVDPEDVLCELLGLCEDEDGDDSTDMDDDTTDTDEDDMDDDTTDTDEDDDTSSTIITTDGEFEVTLNPGTAVGAQVPWLVAVNVASFDVVATEAGELDSLTLERIGLGNDEAVREVTLYVNGVAASQSRSFDSQGERRLSLNPSIEMDEGDRVTVDVVVETGCGELTSGAGSICATASNLANNQLFAISVFEVNGEEVPQVIANEFEIGAVNGVQITVDFDNSTDTLQVWDMEEEVARFDIKNEDNNYNVMITSLTVEDDEGDARSSMENFQLEFDGDIVATVNRMNSNYLTFNFSTPIIIEDGDTEDFVIYADVVGWVDDQVKFILDESSYVQGYDSRYGYGLFVNIQSPDTDGILIDIQAWEVTLEEVFLVQDEMRDDTDEFILAEMDVTINAGTDVSLNDIEFDIVFDNVVGGATPALLFQDVELIVDGDSEDVDAIPTTNTAGTKFVFSDIDTSVPTGETFKVYVVADTENNLSPYVGTQFHLELNTNCGTTSCTGIELEDEVENEDLIDITPSVISFDRIDVVDPSAGISAISQQDAQVVISSTNVDLIKFQVESDDVSPAEIDSFTVRGITNFNDDYINQIKLWRQHQSTGVWELLASEPGTRINTSWEVELDGFRVETGLLDTVVFLVTVDVSTSDNFLGNVQAQIIDGDIEDDDGDDLVLNPTYPVTGRTINIVAGGTLTVELNNYVDDESFILAWEESDFVAAFEVSADDEEFDIEQLKLNVVCTPTTTCATSFEETVQRVYIYDEDRTTKLYGEQVGVINAWWMPQAEVVFNFRNWDFVVSDDKIIYIAVEAKDLGENAQWEGYGTTDFQFTLSITEAQGIDSNTDVTDGPTAVAPAFAIKPVLISDVALTDFDNAELTSATQKIARLRLTADTWINDKQNDSSNAELEVETISVNFYGSAALNGFRLRSATGSWPTVPGVVVGNLVTFTLNAPGWFNESDRELTSWEVANYFIELDGSTTPAPGDSVTIEFDTANGSQIVYAEADDTCTAPADSCVNELRLGRTDFGSASASRQN